MCMYLRKTRYKIWNVTRLEKKGGGVIPLKAQYAMQRIVRHPMVLAEEVIGPHPLPPARDPGALVTEAKLATCLRRLGAALGTAAGVVLAVSPVDDLSLAAWKEKFCVSFYQLL